MAIFETKYFGEIIVDDEGFTNAKYNDQEIRIFFYEYNCYGDKIKTCLEIIDKYIEVDEIARNEIVKNYPKNEIIKNYFKDHFVDYGFEEEQIIEIFGVKDFKDFDIRSTVEKLEYPNLIFGIEDGKIKLSVDYMVYKESDQILCVKMDEKLNTIYFSHES